MKISRCMHVFPGTERRVEITLKKMEKMIRNRSLSNSNKNVLGICFITDIEGYFKYIHPNFLNVFEGVEDQFYETSVLDKNASLGSPSILKYLVAMIQESTPNHVLENRFSKCINKFNKLEWRMVYNRGLLYFSLTQEPVGFIQGNSEIVPDLSPAQILSKEVKKIYWKIEHARMFHANQTSSKKQIEDKGVGECM